MSKTKHKLKFIKIVILITAFSLLSANCKKKNLSSYKYPDANIILILIDTLRADHLGCYGYHRNTSPEIDKLANEGIIFKNMLAQTSWTRPGTASILTGLYPKNHGANTRDDTLAEEINLLSEILGKFGYTSYAYVANGNAGKNVGFNQGYEKFFQFQSDLNRPDQNIHVRSNELNDSLFKLIQQLENTTNNFIYVHYVDPHAPYIPKEKHFSRSNKITFSVDLVNTKKVHNMSKEKRRKTLKEMINAYDDEILFNDKMIGNLIRVLKKKNMYSNSIIIITSDHGEEFFEHGDLSHGMTLYEEQLRVPLIIRLPHRVHREIYKIANQVDIGPTILSLLKIPVPQYMDGHDILDEKAAERRYSFAELDLDTNIIFSIQNMKNKFLEVVSLPDLNPNNSHWFKQKAIIATGEDSLELIIDSLHKERFIRVLANGNPVEKLKITPLKQTFNIRLPELDGKKTIVIRSLTPCQVPKILGMNRDTRCLSFRIYYSKNVNENSLLGELYHEYYVLSDDPGEKNNFFYQTKFKKIIMQLRKKLKGYKLEKRSLQLNKKPVIFDEEQQKALKVLGYI